MAHLISVIVPVYNTERYLDKCVQSILNQTYKNLEIILVDDGSTDASAEKCDDYALKDKRIRVIHKANGGQSSARNVALDVCTGKYIAFVDSDDWIEPEMYEVLLQRMEENDASLAVCGRSNVYENFEKKANDKSLGREGVFDAYDILPQMAISRLSDFSVCDKLHKRSLWENIRFPEGEIYEDFAVMYKVLLAAKKVVLCDCCFYVYFHRKNSTVITSFKENLIDYTKQTKDFMEYISAYYPEYIKYAVWTYVRAIQVVLIKLLRSDKKTYRRYKNLYKNFLQELNKYREIWKKDSLFTRNDKMLIWILKHKLMARVLFLIKKES